jgi:ABC-type glycerol-3-phosphate transport system substrate-binding protein
LLSFDRDYRNDLNGQLIIIPFPSWYGNGYQNGGAINLYSINSNCKNKEYAYKLLKYMLSEKAQCLKDADENKYSFSYDDGYTVNKKALLRDLNTIGTDKAESILNEYRALSDVTIDNYKFIVENCKTSIRYDVRIESLIRSAANNYIKGKLSEEAVLKKLDDEVDLFLNE